MFKKILNILNTFEAYLGAFCMAVMIIFLFLQVVSRYIFNRAISWTEEMALVFFVLSIYFGSCSAIRRGQHLRLEIILSRFGFKGRNLLLIIGNLFFLLFNCVIMTGLYSITVRLHTFNTRSALTGLPRWIVFTIVLFLFGLTSIRLVQDIYFKIILINNSPQGQLVTEKIKE